LAISSSLNTELLPHSPFETWELESELENRSKESYNVHCPPPL
jgi:hypothetical protein